jgi:hypothetical protein
MTLDQSDDLYVGVCGLCFSGDIGDVTVFAKKQTAPFRTIENGIGQPYVIRYDQPDLYVGDYRSGAVTIYRHGETTLFHTIPAPSAGGAPIAIAFGP